MKKIFLFLAMLSLILTGCGEEKISNELHISAAASLTDAMKEISAEFEKENPDIKIIFNVGSSGALHQAIENGGETDLFFSAAQKQMDALEKSNNLVEGTRKNLLENEVVLIVPTDSDKNISSFTDLTQENINRIALGEFKGVPVGQYSEEILNTLGILDTIKSKIVFGSDVRQVLSWVETGDADCGIVYATDAAISDKVKVVAVAEKNLHKPVIYPAAIIKTSKNLDAAKKFLNFVETEPAKNIFSKFGFKVIN